MLMRSFLLFAFVSVLVLFTGCDEEVSMNSTMPVVNEDFSQITLSSNYKMVPAFYGVMVVTPGGGSTRMVTVDAGGTVRDDRTVPHDSIFSPSILIPLSGGRTVEVGNRYQNEDSMQWSEYRFAVTAVCYAADGTVLWTKSYAGSDGMILTGAYDIAANEVALVWRSKETGPPGETVSVINASTGAIVRTTTLSNMYVQTVHPLSTGELSVVVHLWDLRSVYTYQMLTCDRNFTVQRTVEILREEEQCTPDQYLFSVDSLRMAVHRWRFDRYRSDSLLLMSYDRQGHRISSYPIEHGSMAGNIGYAQSMVMSAGTLWMIVQYSEASITSLISFDLAGKETRRSDLSYLRYAKLAPKVSGGVILVGQRLNNTACLYNMP